MKGKTSKRNVWRFLGIILFIAAILYLLIPNYNGPRKRSPELKAVANLKSLLIANRAYAADHEGHFPGSLEELYPDYIVEKDCFVSLNEAGNPLPYVYHTGLSDSDDPKSPLVTDPHLRMRQTIRCLCRRSCRIRNGGRPVADFLIKISGVTSQL